MMLTIEESTRQLYEQDELPEDLRWIEQLLPRHQRMFYGEVQLEWSRYCLTGDPSGLIQFFEDWKATADADASPEHSAFLLGEHNEHDYSDLSRTNA
jgi:hypothetical protein